MKYEVGQLVGLRGTERFVKILAYDENHGVITYWCRASPGSKYFILREEDLRKLA